jgi:arylsulfatase A-like enzyme
VDEQLGRVLDALEATGQAERTLVLFVSDHGDMNAAHGFSEKMFFCGYEELFHTPFLMSIPGDKPGRRISAQVSTLDILPTVLEVLGTDGPDQLDGRSMMPLLEGRTQEHRPFCVGNSGEHSFVVAEDRWKYVCHWNPDFLDELYDLEKDPGEMRNLAAETGAESHLRHLRERLADWLETSGHPYRETVLAAMKS